jgi:hypothetical protein
MATLEVWPDMQLIVTTFDAAAELPPRRLDSNWTVPLPLAPESQASVTVAGLPLAYAPSAKSGTATAVANPAANPNRTIFPVIYAHRVQSPPFFPPGHGAKSLDANHLTTVRPTQLLLNVRSHPEVVHKSHRGLASEKARIRCTRLGLSASVRMPRSEAILIISCAEAPSCHGTGGKAGGGSGSRSKSRRQPTQLGE